MNEVYESFPKAKVSINPMYPPAVWDLYMKVCPEAKRLGYSNPWVEGVLVYVRKSKDTPKILIRSIEDLRALLHGRVNLQV